MPSPVSPSARSQNQPNQPGHLQNAVSGVKLLPNGVLDLAANDRATELLNLEAGWRIQ